MKKLLFYPIGGLLLLLIYSCSSSPSSSTAVNDDHAMAGGKPNIIFILADDLGSAEVASYGNGFNETPNLDRLEAEGIKFTNAYAAAAVCSPTRGSIMTGQYPARVGITDFLAPKTGKSLDPEKFVTINEALADAGYHTGMIGKWHLDTDFKNNNPHGPESHGFDEVIGTETKYIADGDYFYPYDKINTFTEGADDEFLTDRLTSEAVDFIKRNKEKPFFLYLSHYSVHTTLDAPQALVEKYKKKFDEKYGEGQAEKLFDGEKNKRHMANHIDNPYLAAMIERIDAGVGSVMAELERNGLDENTLIIFFSDNGGAFRVANNGGLRMHKTWLYEGGIKEPLLMRWPAKIKAGSTTDAVVSSIDFYPTFTDAAGVKIREGHQVDGVSLLPLITEGKAPERDTHYWHYPSETGNWQNRMAGAIRQGDYKLIRFYEDNRIELYNLGDDPQEKHDLSEKMPKKAEELENLLNIWLADVEAEMPVIN